MNDTVELDGGAERRRPFSPQSARFHEKISLLTSSTGKTLEALYFDVEKYMARRGFLLSRASWQTMLTSSDIVVRPDALLLLAEVFDVDARYLLFDRPTVDRVVESALLRRRVALGLSLDGRFSRGTTSSAPVRRASMADEG